MLYRTRTPEERNIIVSNFADPYSLENFLSSEDISELINLYQYRENKIHKHTGPITSELKDDFDKIDILKKIQNKIKDQIGDCKIYTGFYFHVNQPHIIHNDDDKLGPIVYKAFTRPLKLEYQKEDTGYPYLCMFDQYYLEGPSKFFGGANIEVKEYYNSIVYEYTQVQNLSTDPFDQTLHMKYLSHLKPHWLKGLSFQSAQEWRPGNAIVFDAVRLHCSSNFVAQGIKSKLGISIFTQLP